MDISDARNGYFRVQVAADPYRLIEGNGGGVSENWAVPLKTTKDINLHRDFDSWRFISIFDYTERQNTTHKIHRGKFDFILIKNELFRLI